MQSASQDLKKLELVLEYLNRTEVGAVDDASYNQMLLVKDWLNYSLR